MQYTQDELKQKLELHRLWLQGDKRGQRLDLSSANLSCANLSCAKLSYANLSYANLPPPPIVLLANWGELSEKLTVELMRYDAANHPDPSTFDDWAKGGGCPYGNVNWQRSANFREKRELWEPGLSKSALELLLLVFAEKGVGI